MGYFFLHKTINFIMKEIKLTECKLKIEYLISKINIETKKIRKHLESLMIKENEKIFILAKNYKCKSFMVKVLGINYAIEKIYVKKY